MSALRRYARLCFAQLRSSLLLALQYRSDFLFEGLVEALAAFTFVVPLVVVYGSRSTIGGWTFGEALLVTGCFTLLQGVIEGAISPNVMSLVEHIRKGTLDFVLLKPADAQFLVSTARFQPWRATDLLASIVVFAIAFREIGHGPSASNLAVATAILGCGLAVLYSLWMLTAATAFYVVKVDNLAFLFGAVFDAARWPASVFRGALRFVFTFVLPFALMTTYPAEALLGRLGARTALLGVALAIVFTALSRLVWKRAIAQYTSASS